MKSEGSGQPTWTTVIVIALLFWIIAVLAGLHDRQPHVTGSLLTIQHLADMTIGKRNG
jgi:hypothetical protein